MLREVEHDLWLWSTKLDSWACWLFHFLSCVCKKGSEVLLQERSILSREVWCCRTNLELFSRVVHIATVFVIVLCVTPDERHLFLESVPGLEVGSATRWRTTMLASSTLRNAFQRYWMPDDFVVVLQFPRRQVAEWRVDFKTTVGTLALMVGH